MKMMLLQFLKLAGKTHQVYTAVYIISKENQTGFVEASNVTFKPMSDEDILAYVATRTNG